MSGRSTPSRFPIDTKHPQRTPSHVTVSSNATGCFDGFPFVFQNFIHFSLQISVLRGGGRRCSLALMLLCVYTAEKGATGAQSANGEQGDAIVVVPAPATQR